MTTLETTQALPLRLTPDGTIRLASTRVSLDSVVYHYRLGATAEQIAQKFPALDLADIYGAITYYLNHLDEVEAYLRREEAEGDEIQKRLEVDPQYQQRSANMRSRLLARKKATKRS
jgi:uncharacterized protein (DUF433 family)